VHRPLLHLPHLVRYGLGRLRSAPAGRRARHRRHNPRAAVGGGVAWVGRMAGKG
jgi:hypothetical protein